MAQNKDIMFNQVTCIEHLEDNEKMYLSLINSIKDGNAKDVVNKMKSWPKSNLNPIYYDEIIHLAGEYNENIVYDDFNYLLTANNGIIVLYQRINQL